MIPNPSAAAENIETNEIGVLMRVQEKQLGDLVEERRPVATAGQRREVIEEVLAGSDRRASVNVPFRPSLSPARGDSLRFVRICEHEAARSDHSGASR